MCLGVDDCAVSYQVLSFSIRLMIVIVRRMLVDWRNGR